MIRLNLVVLISADIIPISQIAVTSGDNKNIQTYAT